MVQVSKYLELSTTSRTAEVVGIAAEEDKRARGLEAPNNGRIATIHHFLAARVSPWVIPKESLPRTGMMHQNSGRRFQDTG